MEQERNSRRDFIKTTAVVGAGLSIAFYLPSASAKTAERMTGMVPENLEMNAFLKIGSDDSITVIIKHLEMGQGIYTALPMILNEELGADWTKIKVETAPADSARYANLLMGMQGTGGSSSIANSWTQLRTAGATAREMLIDAAATEMKVDRKELKVQNGKVVHHNSGRSLTFGGLSSTASKLAVPKDVKLKDLSDFTTIGKSLPRLDNDGKTSGTTTFSLDINRPNQLVALIARPPRFGGKVKSINSKAAMKVHGVKAIYAIPQGVAVVAENFWAAKSARDVLKVTWDDSAAFKLSTDEMRTQYRALFNDKGAVAKEKGDVVKAAAASTKKITAEYEFPYLAHAPMEPLNCVIDFKDGKCEIWSGSQMPSMDQGVAAKILGLKPTDVKIYTQFAGGSFGRRATATADLVTEAASLAREAQKKPKVAKRPIHLMWTREDDVQGGYYRPYFLHKAEVGLDSHNKLSFWNHRIVGQSIMAGGPFSAYVKNGVDGTSVEGVSDLPYDLPNLYVDLHSPVSPVPVLWLRSVGHTHTAFVVETLVDELAALAGKDEIEFRLDMLKSLPRQAAVLKLVAEKANWKTAPPKGIARGVALHESFNTIVAAVIEVSNNKDVLKVEKIVCALDCGIVVNPDNVVAQLEGGLGFGLSVALHGAINFDKGEVVESNFHNYKVLRMSEMPPIEVHTIVSKDAPTGVGEPGVPVVAPAIANALAKLTGKRTRKLPFQA